MPEEGQDPINPIGKATSALGELVNIAKDSEEGKQSAKNVGKTAIIITEAIHNCLLPIAAVNYGIAKAKNYFQNRFSKDIESATAKIPPENISEPKSSIVGPALQGLAFSHEEEELRALYINLIAGSMDSRIADKAHPAYVEVIKQLTSFEASVLKNIMSRPEVGYPCVKLQKKIASGHTRVFSELLDWESLDPDLAIPKDAISSMLDNWSRLGIASFDYANHFSSPEAYKWVSSSITYKFLEQTEPPGAPSIVKGMMMLTAFGRCFAEAVGIRQRPPSSKVTIVL